MLKPRPRLRQIRPSSDAVLEGASAPSLVAQTRLEDALRGRADAYRVETSVDLTMLETLLSLDDVEAAAQTLEEHRASLLAMAHDLQVVVADAAVEREAERVWETCLEDLELRKQAQSGLRRRLLAVTGAVAVVVALLLPTGRITPRTTLVSVDERSAPDDVLAARDRLAAAQSTAAAVRAQAEAFAERTDARNAVVRHTVRALLAAGSGTAGQQPEKPPAEVTVLSRVRAAKDRVRNTTETGYGDRPPAPVIPLRLGDTGSLVGEAPDVPTPDVPTPDADILSPMGDVDTAVQD
jgi:hypothetical protein